MMELSRRCVPADHGARLIFNLKKVQVMVRTSPFAAKLAKHKDAWKSAQSKAKEAGGYGNVDDLPPGKYKVALTNAALGETDGRLWIRWEWGVLEGDHAGSKQSALDGLETEQNLIHFGRKVGMFGYDPDDLDLQEIPEFLETLLAEQSAPCRIVVKQNGDYINVYLNEVMDDDDVDNYDTTFGGDAAGGDGESEEAGPTWTEYGATVDAAGDDTNAAMVDAASDAGLDPDEFETWELLGAVLDGGAVEPEPEPEPEPTDREPTWTEYGAAVDASGADTDAEMVATAKESDLDPDEFATWELLGAALDADDTTSDDDEPADDDEPVDDDEPAEGEVVIGADVIATYKGKEVEGTITALDEESETVTVKPADGQPYKKAFKVSVESIELLD